MQIKNVLYAFIFCAILSGCQTNVVEAPKPSTIHPELPAPVGKYNVKWKVIPQDDHVYVGLTYDDSLQLKLMIEDLLRYIRESNTALCSYRRDLQEPRCVVPIGKAVTDSK